MKILLANLRASLWFVPGLMIIAGIVSALGLVELDSRTKAEWLANYPRLFGLGADGARGMLTAIASSMLTVAALAFSLTLSAVSQASGQFTPRIFRNFMRDRANQFVLGYFVSVFVFCLIVLRTIRGAGEIKFVPSFAVMTGLLLALGGVIVLIFFIHHIADSLQITTILDKITNETENSVEKLFPQGLGDPAGDDERKAAQYAATAKDWIKVSSDDSGYLQTVETNDLLAFAVDHKVLIKMRRGIGDYVGTHAALAEIAADTESDAVKMSLSQDKIKQVAGYFSLNRHRTIEQDVRFGIRQIVDIALKALSPGVNDTTTAVNCIDHLGKILGAIARRQIPSRVRSQNGIPRVIVEAPDFQDLIEIAFDQIRVSGKANQAIYERLIETLAYIGENTSAPSRRAVLMRQIELTSAAADRTLETDYEKQKVRFKIDNARRELAG